MRGALAFVLAMLLALFAIACAPAPTAEVPVEARWGDGDGPYTPLASFRGEPSGNDGSDVYRVRFAVPALPACEDPAFIVLRAKSLTAARIGDREIDVRKRPYGLIAVRAGDAGKPVVLEFRTWRTVHQGPILAGCEHDLLVRGIFIDALQFSVGVFLLIGGVGFGLISLVRRSPAAHKWLAAFMAAFGVVSLGQSNLYRAILVVDPTPILWATSASQFITVISLVRFSVVVFGDVRFRALSRIADALAGTLAVAVVLDLLHVFDIVHAARLMITSGVMFVAPAIIALARIGGLARRGDRAAAQFTAGIVALLVCEVPDILWAAGHPIAEMNFGPIGVMLFVASLGVVLTTRYGEQSDKLTASNVELERRLAELETKNAEVRSLNTELMHQIEQRSRDLAEAMLEQTTNPPASSLELQPGAVVERYRVVKKLGEGGMGAVYEVERRGDAKRLALKVMTGKSSAAQRARFAREAEVAAKISHPNVVAIADVGKLPQGAMFLVMELVTGRDLEDARDRFGDVPWALGVLGQIAAGLAALHRIGIVHRDIKPSNVMLQTDGASEIAKVTDFGIARAETTPELADTVAVEKGNASASSGSKKPQRRLTQSGAIVGTPAYMAPELANGDATPASDIYALGVVAFEMLTRERPFKVPSILLALGGTDVPGPPPLDVAGLNDDVRALLARALATDPAMRPTAAELTACLG